MANTPPASQASLAGIAQLGGALAAGYAAIVFTLNGSHLWLVLGLITFLAWPLSFFPVEKTQRGRFVAGALGLYGPIIAAFYLLSYGRSALGSEEAQWLAVGASVTAIASLTQIFALPTARRALPWFAGALLCGLLIGFFSGGRGSGEPWKDYLVNVQAWDPDRAEWAVILLRKSIHFCFYGLLSLLAAKGVRMAGATANRAFLFALLWTLAHASFDEMRQVFVSDRSGSAYDVLLDMTGVLVFTSPYWLAALKRWRRKRRSSVGAASH